MAPNDLRLFCSLQNYLAETFFIYAEAVNVLLQQTVVFNHSFMYKLNYSLTIVLKLNNSFKISNSLDLGGCGEGVAYP